MIKNILIENLDHFGNGVAHINNKVVFVNNALPNEIVDIEITLDKKNYSEAKVINYIKKSDKRIESICPYFNICGGCNLLFYNYEDTINFKINKVKELFKKNVINYNKDIEIIKNKNNINYRNKISLKIIDGKIGYYKENTHELVEINNCIIAKEEINKVINNYKLLNIKNGNLIIRCNANNEILLIINSNDNENINTQELKKTVKLVGIIYNDNTIYGENFFYERIGGYLFKVSYNSFFQINDYICEELFELIKNNVDLNSKVIDLYSGVGTLGIVASFNALNVISVEIIKNAVLNGIYNANLNHRDNINFLLGDVSKTVNKINNNFDTLILDPPRKGLDNNTINFIKEKLPNKIIYVSCNINTLIRDIKLLEEYYIDDYKILDMFSYSYHLESFVVLKRSKTEEK